MVQRLMQQLLESDKYAERRGAAYGLAGLVKGLGILSLKQQEMMAALTDAIQDKKNFRRREGECLSGPEAAREGTLAFPSPPRGWCLHYRGTAVCDPFYLGLAVVAWPRLSQQCS